MITGRVWVPSGASHGILSMCLPINTVVQSSAYGSEARMIAAGIMPVADGQRAEGKSLGVITPDSTGWDE